MIKFFSSTGFIGKDIIFMPTCHSTNDIAADLLKKKPLGEGTIVITGNQTAGRGQRGNTWESEPGKNITCSIVFQPFFLEPSDNFYLNVFSSLAIVDYLSEFGRPFKVKWPNDIFYENKKICGLLVENSIKGNRIGHSILGIGLNINQLRFNVPGAISLSAILSQSFDLFRELEKLSIHLENRYLQLRNHEYDLLKENYLENLYWMREERLFYDSDFFTGRIIGISQVGRLLIETGNEAREYGFKEVRFIR